MASATAAEKKRFGRIYMVMINVFWSRPQEYYDSAAWRGTWAMDGGSLMNQGIHYVDLLRWCMGPVTEVTAVCATQAHQVEVEDTALAIVRFGSGAVGTILSSTAAYPGFPQRLEITGTDGTVIVEDGRVVGVDAVPPRDDIGDVSFVRADGIVGVQFVHGSPLDEDEYLFGALRVEPRSRIAHRNHHGGLVRARLARLARDQRFEDAAVAIFVAMVLDGLDGRVARLIKGLRERGLLVARIDLAVHACLGEKLSEPALVLVGHGLLDAVRA